MLSIRFARTGKKKAPQYSIIVVEKSKDPWGDYTEKLGTYNPDKKIVDIKADRAQYWIGIGAQPTPTVHNLLVAQGIIKDEKVRAGKSKPGKKRTAEIAAAKKAEEDAKQAEIDAKAKAEADRLAAEEAAKAAAEASVEEVKAEETPAETTEAAAEEAKAE